VKNYNLITHKNLTGNVANIVSVIKKTIIFKSVARRVLLVGEMIIFVLKRHKTQNFVDDRNKMR